MARDIVLIHGMWCTGANWQRVAALLQDAGYRTHAPSLPAHELGTEHPQVGALSLRDYREFLEADIAAQNFAQPPILIGHSMGGLLAQQLAARIETAGLVLLTPASPWGINALSVANTIAFGRVLSTPGFWRKPHKPTPARAARSAYNGIDPARQAALYATLVPESGRAVFEIGLWMLDRTRASAVDAAAVQCPVYVLSAGEDRLTPPQVVRKVAALYPGAARRHNPERSHWVIDDAQTEDMVGDIVNWIRAIERRSAQRGARRA